MLNQGQNVFSIRSEIVKVFCKKYDTQFFLNLFITHNLYYLTKQNRLIVQNMFIDFIFKHSFAFEWNKEKEGSINLNDLLEREACQ